MSERGTGKTNQNPPGVGLRALLREDLARHGGDKSRPGYQALRAHRVGNWRMGLGQPWRGLVGLWYRRAFRRCRNVYGVELPYAAKIGRRLTIEHQGGIVVHGHAVLGDGCTIRQGVTIGNKTPDRPHDAPTLGDNVNVGAGAKILGAVTLGDGCQIGANAVVVKDVPAGAVAVGVPAKLLDSSTVSTRPHEEPRHPPPDAADGEARP